MPSMARDNRRRRVLNEELRTATSAAGSTTAASTGAAADAPRYGEQANIEHHPQITDFIPRRKRAVLNVLIAGVGVAAGTQLMAQHAGTVAGMVPGASDAHVANQLAHGIAAWTAAMGLVLVAALARIIYSLRRHRVNDVRGRYRVWRWVAAGSFLASVNAVVGAHAIVGRAAASLTGWSLTAGAAEWWLTPLAVVGGWIGLRLMAEISESRAALALATLAATSYALAAAGALGWSPAVLSMSPGVLVGALPLVGHALLLAATMVFGRYVVLDVQGLVEHKPRRPAASAAKSRKAAVKSATPATPASGSTASAPTPSAKPAAASAASWADDEEDDDEPAGDRRLSKAERKRLRKQGRAA